MRRMIDIFFASACLLLTLPLMLIVAILIKLESAGPVFYHPKMVGWHGKVFSLIRFRTMYVNVEKAQRLTHVGRLIRNYSLDHLPQLINLLQGDLTLVGPRPMEVDVVDLRGPTWQQYVQVRPGIFNYAIYQLGKQWTPSRSSRPHLNQELELEYMGKRSAVTDLRLVLRSLQKLIMSRGNIKERGEVDPELSNDQNH